MTRVPSMKRMKAMIESSITHPRCDPICFHARTFPHPVQIKALGGFTWPHSHATSVVSLSLGSPGFIWAAPFGLQGLWVLIDHKGCHP